MEPDAGNAAEDDRILARGFAAGDPNCFAEVYKRAYRRVRGLARHLLKSDAHAEDTAAEVFVRAAKSRESFHASSSPEKWLLAITANLCLDRLRRSSREQRIFSDQAPGHLPVRDHAPDALTLALMEERGEELRRLIARLPDRLRLPLTLRYYADLSYQEIAAELGIEKREVAALIFRAKRILRIELTGQERKEAK
ncbi:MAG: sigma-70 family RNA polymerase sigma factor [Bryobacteraceae bacterium]|nr:sigma-70 family RNA polymerase sigma factor [Bryobacteraceae bacterium]